MPVPANANVMAPIQGTIVLVSTDRGQARVMKLEAVALTEAQVLGVLGGTVHLEVKIAQDDNSIQQTWAYLDVFTPA